ncbi:MAG: flagellar basal body-associated FliL family protein [Candidatus Kryptoniota bacterium]
MAETVQETAPVKPDSGKGGKLIIIVLVVIVQLIAAYFLIGLFLRKDSSVAEKNGISQATVAPQSYGNRTGDPDFDHVYVVKDLIVNPAGTNGLRFLLTTIGLEATSEQTVKELEKRDVQVRDAIIQILTSKTLIDLDNPSSRDSLKIEIAGNINRDLVTGRITNVYFSKFIIQ